MRMRITTALRRHIHTDSGLHMKLFSGVKILCFELDSYMTLAVVYAALLTVIVRAVGGETCGNEDAPYYVSLECAIFGGEIRVRRQGDQPPSRHIDQDSSKDCLVTVGLELRVTCRALGDSASANELVLFRNGRNYGSHTMFWSYTTSLESGMYECRWRDNGTSFANRSVVVDEKVYVIPGAEHDNEGNVFAQDCQPRIAGDFQCSVAKSLTKTWRVQEDKPTFKNLSFNVLGARPVFLSLDLQWVNHYPVNLHLSLSSDSALNNTISHIAHVDFYNLVLVGDSLRAVTAKAYLVITGTTSSRNSTLCVLMKFFGVPVLLHSDRIPANLSVAEGQPAQFHCKAQSTQEKTFTVAFLVKLHSLGLTECSKYTFSATQSLLPAYTSQKGSCSGLNFSVNIDHYLTATWPSVNLTMSGAEVVCAQASSGITQWAQTATLTVILASVVPSTASSDPNLNFLAILSPLALLLVVVLIFLFWWKRRQHSSKQFGYQLQQTVQAVPSSVCSSPTNATPQFPLLPRNTYPSAVNQVFQLLHSVHGADSVVNDVESNGSNCSLSYCPADLLYPSSYEVCVYVSYSNSQADWVQDTLLPLLHSFQPIRVTDHEGHMIPGGVVSEERLRLLQSADKVVAVIAPDYQMTEWCNYELQHVLQQSSMRGAGLIIPILCGGCRDLPSTISTLHPLSLDDPQWTHKLRIAIRRQHQ